MTTDEHILLTLQLVERLLPPPEGMHHSLAATEHKGQVKLTLQIAAKLSDVTSASQSLALFAGSELSSF